MDEARDQGPHHLAQTVLRALSVSASQHAPEPPEARRLEFFFDVLYQASFRGDAARPLTGRVIWQDPANSPGTMPPGALHLLPPVPLNITSLAALLAAAEPSSALLVSGADPLPLTVSGITPGTAPGRTARLPPGTALLIAEILGPAHLKVDVGLDYPLELRRNRVHHSTQKVFERGLVRSRLSALLSGLFPAIQAALPADIAASPLLNAGSFPLPGGSVLLSEQDWPDLLERFWVSALIHLLGAVFETRQSGMVILTPRRDAAPETLPRRDDWLPPHLAMFPDLRQGLEKRAALAIVQQVQAVRSLSERSGLEDIALDDLTLQEPALTIDAPGDDPEIASAIRFLASLSRGEGLLRLDPMLDLISFGGQPPADRLPERVYLAGDETASDTALSPISSRSFGPRNQALLRLCQSDPEAVGFAFTQDGDVRAMLRHEDKLIVWSSVRLPRY